MIAPEFSRLQRLDQIGAGDSQVEIAADPGERAALAKRFDLPAIDRLEARFSLHRIAAGVQARGHLSADVTQSCIATGVPLTARLEEDFDIRFVPETETSGEELEFGEEEGDTVFFTGNAIDLGEAAAETLALSLDPFPRSPEAEAALREAGVLSEEEARSVTGPFSALAGLKDKLSGGS